MTDADPTPPENAKSEAECDDAREAADMGERPDLGHKADTLIAVSYTHLTLPTILLV